MDSPVELIKERLNILDVVSQYVDLKKAGKSYKGKSPFNHERTPSFFVHPDKGFFYDFSAGFGGDIFTFIQKIERVDFKEALKILAEKAGVSLQEGNFQSSQEKQRLFRVHELATKWYQEQLFKNENALSYLKDRGLNMISVKKFMIGFAPKSWNALFTYLEKEGVSKEDMVKSGLVVQKDQSRFYDRFRSRIIFPLFDPRGRVVAFSGRIFQDDSPAKYVNSPETILYEKSKLLYPYHLAKSAFSKKDTAILVEGQFDVILSHQSGLENIVAVSGTGLSDEQLDLIKRFTRRIVFSFDADSAGMKATRRSVQKAYRHGFDVALLILPEGRDPADIIQSSPEQWELIVSEPIDYIDYEIQQSLKKESDFHKQYSILVESIFPVIAEMKSSLFRERAIGKLAEFFGITKESLLDDFTQFLSEEKGSFLPKDTDGEIGMEFAKERGKTSVEDSEKEVILLTYALREIFPDFFHEKESQLREELRKIFGKSLEELVSHSVSDEEKNMIIFVVEEENFSAKRIIKKIFDSLAFLRILQLEKRLDEIEKEIQRKTERDEDIPVQLLKESQDVLREIDLLKNADHF